MTRSRAQTLGLDINLELSAGLGKKRKRKPEVTSAAKQRKLNDGKSNVSGTF